MGGQDQVKVADQQYCWEYYLQLNHDQTFYSYVMNTRVFKKKQGCSPAKPSKKSKSKSKSKEKKFNAKDYLQALIDLQNTNCSTNKKRKNTKRDISSALTIATPALEKTISASKIRSKSSFSQYRKKYSSTTRQPLNLNLEAVITEEDNVQYTEKTARSSQKEPNNEGVSGLRRILHLNKDLCAIKIQRAWRNYQTYKMVHRMFLKEEHKNRNKNPYQPQPALHINIKKLDSSKTLKIRRESNKGKETTRRNQQISQTEKIIMERYREQESRSIERDKILMQSPIEQMLDLSMQSSNMNNMALVMAQLKQKQAERFQEVIEMIQKNKQAKTKQELLDELVKKFEENKKRLQEDLQNQLQFYDFNESVSTQKIMMQAESHRQVIKIAGQKEDNDDKQKEDISIRQKSVDNLSVKEYLSSNSSFAFDYDNVSAELPELKIFQQRLNNIRHHKLDCLEKIDDDLDEGKLSSSSAMKKKDIVYGRYEREKKQIQKNKKQYLFSLTQLKYSALNCHRQNLKESTSLSKLRKCFSVGNTIVKSVIEEIKIFELSEQHSQKSLLYHLFSKDNLKNHSKQLEEHIPFPSPESMSPEQRTPEKEISESANDKNNTESLKLCSQDIQEIIEKFLIDEFTTQVYLDENLYKYVKPYIEEVYEFKKIPDEEISGFLQKLAPHMPGNRQMLERVNQKINPTSNQILRIIRDIDFEIEEYELIIPQECFKSYRQQLERQYEEVNKRQCPSTSEIGLQVSDYKTVQKIYERQVEKSEKMKKYRNFERDLKIMYMKSVFNCINELLIQVKSANAFMNGRSSIGPGELSLAIKEYNEEYSPADYQKLLGQVSNRLGRILQVKCAIPSFKNYYDLEAFQKQIMHQISSEYHENEFKWVNYMDEVLEIWEDVCSLVFKDLFREAASELLSLF